MLTPLHPPHHATVWVGGIWSSNSANMSQYPSRPFVAPALGKQGLMFCWHCKRTCRTQARSCSDCNAHQPPGGHLASGDEFCWLSAIACTQAFRLAKTSQQRLDSIMNLREGTRCSRPVAPVDATLPHDKDGQVSAGMVGADLPELRGLEDQSPFELSLRSHKPLLLLLGCHRISI